MLPHFESMLAAADDVLFLHGACHIFALALSNRFGYSMRMVRYTHAKVPSGATHVFCAFDASHGVDVLGLFHERKRLLVEEWLPPRFTVRTSSKCDVERFFTETSGGGLYAEPAFVSRGRDRALLLIERFNDHYSGRIRTPVPGLKRVHKIDSRTLFNGKSNADAF